MIFGYFILTVALVISAVSAFYSITGLTAIFAAAFWPIIIMGSALEVGKIATTVWLHKYWHQAAMRYKLYLVPAVAVLMLITSMGIFGFLSKAHLDQAVPSGDVAAKVSLYDEKIAVQRENIKAARANLAQLDAAVNETMGRSTSEQGADKAVAIRRAQGKDRAKLMQEIEQSQKVITQLQEERAPIAAEQRKVEAEVGPIKYIAALIYDQGAAENSDLLERAVRWVIILIVSVFDPLALVLILAATQTIEWERSDKRARTMDQVNDSRDEEPIVLADTNNIVASLPPEDKKRDWSKFFYRGKRVSDDFDNLDEAIRAEEANKLLSEIEPEEKFELAVEEDLAAAQHDIEQLLDVNTELVADNEQLRRQVDELVDQLHTTAVELEEETPPKLDVEALKKLIDSKKIEEVQVDERPGDYVPEPIPVPEAAPGRNRGVMTSAAVIADNTPAAEPATHSDFGSQFPENPSKGDTYLRVDYLPNRLFKFNGIKWLELDKNEIDMYAYNEMYIKHLIDQIAGGKMEIDQLSDLEREQIQEYLRKNI